MVYRSLHIVVQTVFCISSVCQRSAACTTNIKYFQPVFYSSPRGEHASERCVYHMIRRNRRCPKSMIFGHLLDGPRPPRSMKTGGKKHGHKGASQHAALQDPSHLPHGLAFCGVAGNLLFCKNRDCFYACKIDTPLGRAWIGTDCSTNSVCVMIFGSISRDAAPQLISSSGAVNRRRCLSFNSFNKFSDCIVNPFFQTLWVCYSFHS